MVISEFALFGIAQVVLLFIGISVFLYLYNRRISKKNKVLKDKVLSANNLAKKHLALAKKAKKAAKAAKLKKASAPPVNDFSLIKYLNKTLEETRMRFDALSPDKDSDNDIGFNAADTPEKKTAALRYQLLKAEKQIAEKDDPKTVWNTVESSLKGFIQQIDSAQGESEDSEDGLSELTTQIIKLRQDLESAGSAASQIREAWENIQSNASSTYSKLLKLIDENGDPIELRNLLDAYHNNLNEFTTLITGDSSDHVDSSLRMEQIEEDDQFESTLSSDLFFKEDDIPLSDIIDTNLPELEQLREINVQQSKLIQELKDALSILEASDDKEALLKEYVNKIKKLETLIEANANLSPQLEAKLTSAESDTSEKSAIDAIDKKISFQIQTMVDQFSSESQDLISTIRSLEGDLAKQRAAHPEINQEKNTPEEEDSFLSQVGISENDDTFSTDTVVPTIEESDASEQSKASEQADDTVSANPDELITNTQSAAKEPEPTKPDTDDFDPDELIANTQSAAKEPVPTKPDTDDFDPDELIASTQGTAKKPAPTESDTDDFDPDELIASTQSTTKEQAPPESDSADFNPDEVIANIEEAPDDPEALLAELIKENGLDPNDL